MTNTSKAKGTQWETACLALVREVYPDAIRSPAWGIEDRGDLHGTGPFTVECKAVKAHDFSGWLKEAVLETQRAGTKYPVVFAKRRNHSAAEGYAVMRIGDYIELMKEAA